MPEPQDIAALREEVARAIYSFDSWPTESSGMPAAYEVTDVVLALPTVLALLSEVERGRALRAAVEALAEDVAATAAARRTATGLYALAEAITLEACEARIRALVQEAT